MTSPLGQHFLFDFYGCSPARLNDLKELEESFVTAARDGGATVVGAHFHHFNPIGISGVVVIAESHLALHTWPEHGFAAVDLFSCSPDLDWQLIGKKISAALEANDFTLRQVPRGQIEPASSLQQTLRSNEIS